MISVFLDESGNFEDKYYKVKFIGGLIYDGDDVDEEKNRLENFFRNLCQDLNIAYPKDIHTTELSYENEKIQRALRERLINYIYNNSKYHFVYMLWGNNRRTYINNTSNIVEEETASNLYDNIIANLIQNILFYNPYLSNKKYHLNIATRVALINKFDTSKIKEYERLGYQGTPAYGQKYMYFLNSNTSIKAAISSKIIANRINKDIETIDLKVEKVNYRKNERDQNSPTTPFLYAADIACDLIKDTIAKVSDLNNQYRSLKEKLININKKDLYIYETVKELERISGNKAFAWAYDDIEGLWGDLNLAIDKGDFLSASDSLYEIKIYKSPYSQFYYDFWCSKSMEYIDSIFDEEELSLYISKIETYLDKDKAKYEKGLFIAEYIERLLMPSDIKHKNYFIFKLKDILLRGYNHRGDTFNGHKCIEICRENRDYVDTHEYVNFLNRSLQTYANEFDYDKCIETSYDIECYLDILKDTEEEIAKCLDKKAKGNIERGKILSSIGQFYSFKKERDKALDYFTRALSEFEGSDIDTKITTSYIIHLAIDHKDYELYMKYISSLWKDSSLEEIFDSIVHSRDRFSLFMFLKAIDAFYIQSLSKEFWNRILQFDYNNNGFEMVHPWELILKYMAFISLKMNLTNIADNRISRIDEVKDLGETIKLININSKIEYLLLDSKLNRRLNKDKINKLLGDMTNTLNKYPNIKQVFSPIIAEDDRIILDKLNTIFTYMYR